MPAHSEHRRVAVVLLPLLILVLSLGACALPPNYEANKHAQDAAAGSLLAPSQDTGTLNSALIDGTVVSPGPRVPK